MTLQSHSGQIQLSPIAPRPFQLVARLNPGLPPPMSDAVHSNDTGGDQMATVEVIARGQYWELACVGAGGKIALFTGAPITNSGPNGNSWYENLIRPGPHPTMSISRRVVTVRVDDRTTLRIGPIYSRGQVAPAFGFVLWRLLAVQSAH